jgi:gliding motility-associated protein GldL
MKLEKNINVIASFGAAIVIIGALFKILHWENANEMLMVGMFTEAAIFIMFGYLYIKAEPEKSYDWTKVYPELADGVKSAQDRAEGVNRLAGMEGLSPDMVEKLSKSLKGLAATADSLQEITKAAGATNAFVDSLTNSSQSLGQLNQSVSKATETITSIATSGVETAKFTHEYAKAGEQLGQLNQLYENQIADATKHLQAINGFYNNINATVQHIASTQKDSENFKAELEKLNENMTALNSLYSSMLKAMKG